METTIITINDPRYPALVRSYKNARGTFFCRGNLDLLNTQCVAVIGTREPSEAGRENTKKIAARFAGAGFTIVSGLAAGCDTAAHRGALEVSGGKTIAVLGTTLNKMYPRENESLAQKILDKDGLLITEYDVEAYAPKRFFERDHIQAALSLAVIPVQAGYKSGTQHTITSAFQQKRLVLVPQAPKIDRTAYPDKYAGLPYDRGIVFNGATYDDMFEEVRDFARTFDDPKF